MPFPGSGCSQSIPMCEKVKRGNIIFRKTQPENNALNECHASKMPKMMRKIARGATSTGEKNVRFKGDKLPESTF